MSTLTITYAALAASYGLWLWIVRREQRLRRGDELRRLEREEK